MKNWGILLLALLVPSVPLKAGAALIDAGITIEDTNTGMVWLDLNQTVNMSYVSVLAEMQPGGSLAGYRVATTSELGDLFNSYGYLSTGSNDLWTFWGEVPGERYVVMYYDDPTIDELAVGRARIGLIDETGVVTLVAGDVSISDTTGVLVGTALVRVQTVPVPAALPLFLSGLLLIGSAASRRHA